MKHIKAYISYIRNKLNAGSLIITVVILSFVLLASLLSFGASNPNPDYGVSFSIKYANELGVDWRKNYLALLNDLGFKKVRLMSYWDQIEPKEGEYDFSDLDWQFKQAHESGAKVSLMLGQRQPRWPECHTPDWTNQLTQAERQLYLERFITKVVNRYLDHPALEAWQLENEALNRYFGECELLEPAYINREFNLVKSLDKSHPVVMSLSDQHGLPLDGPVPDIYGFSVYRTFYNTVGPDGYITYPTPLWYHRMRAGIIKLVHSKPIILHELQAEPWGPEPTKNLSVDEQNKSLSPQRLRKNINFAKQIGLKEIYFWGGEFWYWRKEHFNDSSYWGIIRYEIKKQ